MIEHIYDSLPKKAEMEFVDCNILGVKVGTTGYCGGDSGHGGRTYFSLEDLGSTDMKAFVSDVHLTNGKVEILFGGDTELETFVQALEFAAASLREMMKE